MPPSATPMVEFGIPLLAVLVAALFVAGWSKVRQGRWLVPVIAVSVWLALTAALAASGWLARFDLRPPPLMLFFAVSFTLAAVLGFSPLGSRFSSGLPLWILIGAQGFRLPLELVMHEAARAGTMPAQMSFSGSNFDIITGATALIVAWLESRRLAPRWLLWGWNALGSILLINIITIAITSMPLFHAFGTEPRQLNTWVAYFPFVWLPTVLVVAAIFGHILITRRLLQRNDHRDGGSNH